MRNTFKFLYIILTNEYTVIVGNSKQKHIYIDISEDHYGNKKCED